jgi:sugar lactone lactonase YvrE
MVMWTSKDQGLTWTKVAQLTAAAERNHTYARKPVNAHPDFYAIWADGDTLKPSVSYLYFTDRNGSAVWRLPPRMSSDFAKPEKISLPGR